MGLHECDTAYSQTNKGMHNLVQAYWHDCNMTKPLANISVHNVVLACDLNRVHTCDHKGRSQREITGVSKCKHKHNHKRNHKCTLTGKQEHMHAGMWA